VYFERTRAHHNNETGSSRNKIEGAAIFSVDVEDWFHVIAVPGTSEVSDWDAYPSRVARNFSRLLDLLAEHDVRGTCFFLGWVGERFPGLVREASERGHEVGSHGYSHNPAYNMSPQRFHEDISRSKKILEDLLGAPVNGYRAPGFSLTCQTPWLVDKVAEAGFHYDASVFPAPRQHGGLKTSAYAPYYIETDHGSILEFPMSVATVFGWPMCFFGGGYLRLCPYLLMKTMAHQVLRAGRPLIFYVHPREMDPEQPRLGMNALRYFKTYVNLRTTEIKLRRVLREFNAMSFQQYIDQYMDQKLDNGLDNDLDNGLDKDLYKHMAKDSSKHLGRDQA
jgi:polysaccharide deacetylase family protein (PEP-CTERM system associated)